MKKKWIMFGMNHLNTREYRIRIAFLFRFVFWFRCFTMQHYIDIYLSLSDIAAALKPYTMQCTHICSHKKFHEILCIYPMWGCMLNSDAYEKCNQRIKSVFNTRSDSFSIISLLFSWCIILRSSYTQWWYI